MQPFSFYYFTDHFFGLDSRKCIKGKRKSGEVAEPDKPAHRQLGVRPHNVCDDSKVLTENRIKDIGTFHFDMNEDCQNQFKNAYDQDQDYVHGEAHKQLKTCFGFGLVIV